MVRAPLPLARLRVALRAWDLDVVSIESITPGVTADVWRVEAGRPLVAKYAYVGRDEFDVGLRAAEIGNFHGLRVARPVRTRTGEVSVMIEWPDGHWHPLGVLVFVPGAGLDYSAPGVAEVVGDNIGRLQAALARDLILPGPHDPCEYLAYLEHPHDLGEFAGMRSLVDEVVTTVRALHDEGGLTIAASVWDGPETLIDDDGTVGFYDFGFVKRMPVLHGLANRSMLFERGPDRERFLAAWLRHFPIAPSELQHLALFRLLSTAIYGKFMAMRLAAGEYRPDQADRQRQRIGTAIRELEAALD